MDGNWHSYSQYHYGGIILSLGEMDVFKTINKSYEGPVFKDKNSKFIGHAIPLRDKEEVEERLKMLRQKHPNAAHFCYAWQTGIGKENYRTNDDGEPHNSAGMPILGQNHALDLTDILVAVVRYYGGKKLGVGGLINAYRTAAKEVLEIATIIELEVLIGVQIQCTYELVDKILQKARRNNWRLVSKQMRESCKLHLRIRPPDLQKLNEELGYLDGVIIKQDTV